MEDNLKKAAHDYAVNRAMFTEKLDPVSSAEEGYVKGWEDAIMAIRYAYELKRTGGLASKLEILRHEDVCPTE